MAKKIKFNIELDVNGVEQITSATKNVKDFSKVISDSKLSVQDMLQEFNNWGFAYQSISNSVQSISGAINSLTAESRTFSGAMAAANTMAGKSGQEFSTLKEKVAKLSEEIPVARDQLANGLYQVISNGVPEDNWIDYLEKSAKASVGGIANLEEVVKVTSTVIKNYGLAWSDAGTIQDKIQLTAKNGVTSFEQMAQALPRVTANAATLGVSIDELMATFATLTGVSGNTAEVSTQLAAIFTALIKPSSEAATMAEKMGVQFDAAAIKSAGGMRNFLAQLDADVKKYAASSGVLEQEIYGKLFGSAEALRALTPLTGNLAEKFDENVDAMQDSAGTIDEAFKTMGDTGSSQLQKLNNSLGKYTDLLQSTVGNFAPYLNFASQMIVTAASVGTLCSSVIKLNTFLKSTTVVQTLCSSIMGKLNAATVALNVSLTGTAASATAAKIAMRGMLMATGVGTAFLALNMALEAFVTRTEEATGVTAEFDTAESEFSNKSSQVLSSLNEEIKKIKDLINAKKSTTQAVDELNKKYGDIFGNHQTAADWYDTLTKKSKYYAKQLGYEAQMKALSVQLAEKQIQLDANYEKRRELWKDGGAQKKIKAGGLIKYTKTVDTPEYTALKDEAKKLIPSIDDIQKKIDITEKKMQDCAVQIRNVDKASDKHNKTLEISKLNYNQVKKEIEKYKEKLGEASNDPAEAKRLNGILKQLEARKKALEKTYKGLSTSNKNTKKEPKYYKNPTTDEQLSKNISYFSKQRNGKDTPEQRVLIQKIAMWERMRKEIELTKKAQLVPQKLNSDEDVEKALDYLKLKKELADQKDKPAIDKEIAQTELRGAELNRPADLATYQDIDKEIEYQQKRKDLASRDAVQGIQDEIDALEKLKQARTAMDDLNDRLSKARKDFDDATTVEAKVKAQTDIQKIQKEIDTATNGKVTISAEVKPTYIEEGSAEDKRQSYNNAEAKANTIKQDYEMGVIGADEAKLQLKEVNAELEGLGLNPIKIKFDNSGFDKTFSKIKEGWSDIQGLESGIESITSALDGNKNAWEAISGVINGTIQVMESIETIVKFVKDLTAATAAQTAVTNADTAASTANAAAKGAETTASITNTAAKSGEAVANATESGSKLAFPYNLVAIAAGVAAVVGALALVGTFANGGIVGGSSFTGDKLTARVNSGEMILNASQQKRLFAIANGISVPQMSLRRYSAPKIELNSAALGTMANQGSGQKTVKLKLEGRDLVGLIANETRINNRSGRRSNIKI